MGKMSESVFQDQNLLYTFDGAPLGHPGDELWHQVLKKVQQLNRWPSTYVGRPNNKVTQQTVAQLMRTRGHQLELPAIKYEFNMFDRFLIMYNLCVFTCIIFIFVFNCTHVRMSYVL